MENPVSANADARKKMISAEQSSWFRKKNPRRMSMPSEKKQAISKEKQERWDVLMSTLKKQNREMEKELGPELRIAEKILEEKASVKTGERK